MISPAFFIMKSWNYKKYGQMDRTTVDRQGESIISPHNVVCGYNKKIKLLLQQVLSKTKLIGLKIIEKNT